MYETFFGDGVDEQEVLLPSPSQSLATIAPNGGDQPAQVVVSPDEIDAETRLAASTITHAMPRNEQRQWTVILDHWQSGESFDMMRSMVPATLKYVDQAKDLDSKQRDAWTLTLGSFGQQFGNADLMVTPRRTTAPNRVIPNSGNSVSGNSAQPNEDASANDVSTELTAEDQQRLTAWLNALDQAAVDRVVDGAIWRSEDADAFYRQLDQADSLDSHGTSVTVVPLMQQPQVYLGQQVRVSGRVARSELKPAAANPFGVLEYWELWIKPSGGGDRPIVLIVPNVTERIKDVGPDASLPKGPEVRVVGRFFKRLAYGSSLGADAAPVIVGRILNRRQTVTATTRSTTADTMPMSTRFWLALIAALVLGVSFAAFVMWRTAILGKRSREVRGSTRPSPDGFLSSLADHDPSENPIVK